MTKTAGNVYAIVLLSTLLLGMVANLVVDHQNNQMIEKLIAKVDSLQSLQPDSLTLNNRLIEVESIMKVQIQINANQIGINSNQQKINANQIQINRNLLRKWKGGDRP